MADSIDSPKKEVYNTIKHYKIGPEGKMVISHRPSITKIELNPDSQKNEDIIKDLVGDIRRKKEDREYSIVRQ